MTDPAIAQGVLLLFGATLAAVTGLMGWQARCVISAGRSIAVLESLLKEIAGDLKRISHHDAQIAVLENKVGNLKAEVDLCYEKIRELERAEKVPVHRR